MAAIAYTLTAARKYPLGLVEEVNGFNIKYSIPYSDFGGSASTATAATDVVTIALGATPAIWLVDKALVNVTAAFTVTGTQTVTMSVGTTTNVGAFITAKSITSVAVLTPSTGPNTVETITQATATSTIGLVAQITNAAAGSLSLLTTGQADVYLNVNSMASGSIG